MADITDDEARAFGARYGITIRDAVDYHQRLTPDGTVILGQADPGVWSDHLDQAWTLKDGQRVRALDPIHGRPFTRKYHPLPANYFDRNPELQALREKQGH